MARVDYRNMYEALVARIRYQLNYHTEWDYHYEVKDKWETGKFMHQCKKEECEDLLSFVVGMESVYGKHLDANGMVSLHLYKIYDSETCLHDLSCQKGQEPKAVFHETMQAVGGLSDLGVTDNVLDHMGNVRYNGYYGVPLVSVKRWSKYYVWRNDEGEVVDGPDVYLCRYYDTALSAQPVA